MRRALTLCLLALLVFAPAAVAKPAGSELTASIGAQEVDLAFAELHKPTVLYRDGAALATLPRGATSYADHDVAPGGRYSYALGAGRVDVELPAYLVGAATADITPDGAVNLGGFGLGDGTLVPDAIIGRGGVGASTGERIAARAIVFDDGKQAIAIADIETQGMFAAYEDGRYGLSDMAAQVAKDIPALRADHILIASDHTHSGPDTIGAWGGPPPGYLQYVHDQTVRAIEQAFAARRLADVRAGHSDASDLIYNQSCTEALNQSKQPDYTGPDACATPGKDGMVRVVQATAPGGGVVATYMAYAAHAT